MDEVTRTATFDSLPSDGAEAQEMDCIIRVLTEMVTPLAAVIPGECEVVLHDLRLLPNSIVALEGSLTGRHVGGPATDMLLQSAVQKSLETRVGYVGRGLDGQELRCSTIIIRSSKGDPVAALCINCDTKIWRTVSTLVNSMLPTPTSADDPNEPPGLEHFVEDVDDLVDALLLRAIGTVDVPVELMHKRHKMAVVAELKSLGFFILRESVERAGQALGVTRFTVYNYLKELDRGTESPS